MIPKFPVFKNLELSDKKDIEFFAAKFNPYSDFNFTCLWLWNLNNNIELSELNHNLVILFHNDENNKSFFSFLGKNLIPETASILIKYSQKKYQTDYLKFIPEEIIRELPSSKFEKTPDKNSHDYVYFIPNLAHMDTLCGVSLGKKIRHFIKSHPDYEVREYSIQKAPKQQCNGLFYKWAENKHIGNCPEMKEYKALQRLFKLKNENIKVLCLYLNRALVGFTIYEILPDNFVLSHFAKSDTHHDRSITHILNWEEAKILESKGIKHSNWEEDLGLDGLREYKLEYRPCLFLEKFTVKFAPKYYKKLSGVLINNYFKNMNKKSKALFAIFALAVIVSIGITFYNTVILKDFEIIEPEVEGQEL